MLYRIFCIMFVFMFLLVACSGNSQTVTPQAQERAITIAPTSTNTLTPAPSNTPLPTTTPTITTTASTTPTATITPENFALADSGSDIANVRISYANDHTVNIDFKYRADTSGRRQNEQIVTWLLLPEECHANNSDYPHVRVEGTSGQARLTYKRLNPGKCELPFFDMVIGFMVELPGYRTYREVYQEQINQPLSLVWSAPAVTSQALTVKNFSFERTGSWSGIFSFDYVFSPEIPVANEAYRFALSGMGGVFVCEFYAWGPVIKEPEGHYTINIDFYSTQDFRITDPTCAIKYDTLTYDVSVLSLEDLRARGADRIYQHAIDIPITLKKSP